MPLTGMRIDNVQYEAREKVYRGTVTLYARNGTHIHEVTAPGAPGWGYDRALAALCEAGRRARARAEAAQRM